MPAHPREQRHILTYTLLLCTSFSQELIRIVDDVCTEVYIKYNII